MQDTTWSKMDLGCLSSDNARNQREQQMTTPSLEIGKVYMLRGGHVLRYLGLYGGEGPALAFGPVQEPAGDPVGASVAADDVLYEMDKSKMEVIRRRLRDALNRGLERDVEDMLTLVKELL